MKELLVQTAKNTGLIDAERLAKFFEEDGSQMRVDEAMLSCPYCSAPLPHRNKTK